MTSNDGNGALGLLRVRAAAATAGFATMLIEVSMPRLFQPYFGGSVFVWTNIIAVVLVSLAGGYALGARLANRPMVRRNLALLFAIAGVLALIAPTLVGPLARLLLPAPEALAAVADSRAHYEAASFIAAAIMFAIPFVLFGAASPLLVHEASSGGRSAANGAALVLFWGTAGSFAGTLAPTYFLLPLIGTRVIFLGIGAVLIGLAILIGAGRSRRVHAILLCVALLATAKEASGATLRPAVGDETLVREIESRYQYLRLTRDKDGRSSFVRINEGVIDYHSMNLLENRTTGGRYYDTLTLVPSLFPANRPLTIGVLGAGAGTLSAELESLQPGRIAAIHDVEIDPAVSGLAADLGLPERSKTRTFSDDGRRFLARTNAPLYDILYLDAYARQSDIPFHMATVEFMELLRARTVPDGVVAMNLSLPSVEHPLFRRLVASLRAAHFSGIHVLPVEGFPSLVVVARKSADALAFTEVPKDLESRLRYARRFGGIAPLTADAPLTDDFAPVEFFTFEEPGDDR